MGCLSLHVEDKTISDLSVVAESQNVRVTATTECMNVPLSVSTTDCAPDLSATTECKNVPLTCRTTNKNTGLQVRVALVCQVGLGEYEAFYVADEPLVVENGYFRVVRE